MLSVQQITLFGSKQSTSIEKCSGAVDDKCCLQNEKIKLVVNKKWLKGDIPNKLLLVYNIVSVSDT